MDNRYTVDPKNPKYKEGRRMAVELKHNQILAEARVHSLQLSAPCHPVWEICLLYPQQVLWQNLKKIWTGSLLFWHRVILMSLKEAQHHPGLSVSRKPRSAGESQDHTTSSAS